MVNVDPCITHWLHALVQFLCSSCISSEPTSCKTAILLDFLLALARGQKSQDTQPVYHYTCKAKKSSPILVYCLLYL